LQQHPWALIVVDEDATSGRFLGSLLFSMFSTLYYLELRVKTVKYFKSIERVQDEVEQHHAQLKANEILAKQVQ
jgi:glucosamine-6-phosphate deaminase